MNFLIARGTDTDFLDKFNVKPDLFDNSRGRMKNANVLLNLDQMAAGITPTAFQHSTLPHWAQKTHVIHDGIDTNWASRQGISLRVGDHTFNSDSELVTVNRTYEPYLGIHIFIDSLQKVLRDCPNTYVLLVGQDTPNVSYGKKREDGQGWLSILRREYSDSIDWSRVLDLGRISHEYLLMIYQITTVHVYLTYPFVLSWSMLEAMSCEAMVVGSDTQPVQEVIIDGQNGALVHFHPIFLHPK